MRVTLLSVILMIIGAVMMGCTDDIMPCQEATQDVDCAIDWGWDDNDNDAAHGGGDYSMYCNMEISPLEECEEMAAYLDYLPDWLPIDITLDCSEFADMGPDSGYGVCDSDWGWGW
jgi:hypothetical protein